MGCSGEGVRSFSSFHCSYGYLSFLAMKHLGMAAAAAAVCLCVVFWGVVLYTQQVSGEVVEEEEEIGSNENIKQHPTAGNTKGKRARRGDLLVTFW